MDGILFLFFMQNCLCWYHFILTCFMFVTTCQIKCSSSLPLVCNRSMAVWTEIILALLFQLGRFCKIYFFVKIARPIFERTAWFSHQNCGSLVEVVSASQWWATVHGCRRSWDPFVHPDRRQIELGNIIAIQGSLPLLKTSFALCSRT